MAVDVFGIEIKPSDLVIYSGAGNGYIELDVVTRVMPKSVECANSWGKVHSSKVIVISEEKAREFQGNVNNDYDVEDVLETHTELKEKFGIE